MLLCAGQETSDDWLGGREGGRTAREVLPLAQSSHRGFLRLLQPCRALLTLRYTITFLWTALHFTDVHNICNSTNMSAKLFGFISSGKIHCQPKMRRVEAQNSCMQRGGTYGAQTMHRNKLLLMTLQQTCTSVTLTKWPQSQTSQTTQLYSID